jgi:hypothetical protein
LLVLRDPLEGWQFTLQGDPGDLLYTATFDSFEDEWQEYSGRNAARIVDSTLLIETDQPEAGPFSTTLPEFIDFDLRVDARPIEGPLDNGYGVIFRLQAGSPGTFVDDSYYLFLISSDGYYQVRRVIAGEVRELSGWIPSDLIDQGLNVTNRLRVVAVGDRFRFYINGEPVELCIPDDPAAISTYIAGECLDGTMQPVLIDDSIASGRLGGIAMSLGTPGVTVAFDNVLVFQPDESMTETFVS